MTPSPRCPAEAHGRAAGAGAALAAEAGVPALPGGTGTPRCQGGAVGTCPPPCLAPPAAVWQGEKPEGCQSAKAPKPREVCKR